MSETVLRFPLNFQDVAWNPLTKWRRLIASRVSYWLNIRRYVSQNRRLSKLSCFLARVPFVAVGRIRLARRCYPSGKFKLEERRVVTTFREFAQNCLPWLMSLIVRNWNVVDNLEFYRVANKPSTKLQKNYTINWIVPSGSWSIQNFIMWPVNHRHSCRATKL